MMRTPTRDGRARRRFWLAIAGVALAGGIVRVAALAATFPVALNGDEVYYLDVATNIAAGRGHVASATGDRALRPPLHPYLLSQLVPRGDPGEPAAAVVREPSSRRAMLVLQVVLSSALVAATGWLGALIFDRRTGIVAAAFAAGSPTLIAFSHYLWAETTFALLATCGIAAVVHAARSRSWAACAMAGVAFGAATLARDAGLAIALGCAAWSVAFAESGERRRAIARAGVVLATCAAVVAPWSARNAQVLGRAVPVSTIGWFAAAVGNADSGWLRPDSRARAEFQRAYHAIPGELARADFARERALERITAEQPLWIAKKLVRNMAALWSPDSTLLIKLRIGAYGDLPDAARRAIAALDASAYLATLVLAILGASAAPGRRALLPLLAFGGVLALHVAANASVRFRVPLMPLLMIYASAALASSEVRLRERTPGRRLAAAAVLTFVAATAIPHFAPEARALWFGAAGPADGGRITPPGD